MRPASSVPGRLPVTLTLQNAEDVPTDVLVIVIHIYKHISSNPGLVHAASDTPTWYCAIGQRPIVTVH